jgi:hypothetical protein
METTAPHGLAVKPKVSKSNGATPPAAIAAKRSVKKDVGAKI